MIGIILRRNTDSQSVGALVAINVADENDSMLQRDYVCHNCDTTYQRLDNELPMALGVRDRSWCGSMTLKLQPGVVHLRCSNEFPQRDTPRR